MLSQTMLLIPVRRESMLLRNIDVGACCSAKEPLKRSWKFLSPRRCGTISGHETKLTVGRRCAIALSTGRLPRDRVLDQQLR